MLHFHWSDMILYATKDRKIEPTKKKYMYEFTTHTSVVCTKRTWQISIFFWFCFFLSTIPKLNFSHIHSTRSCLSTHTQHHYHFYHHRHCRLFYSSYPESHPALRDIGLNLNGKIRRRWKKKKRELMRRRRRISIILYNPYKNIVHTLINSFYGVRRVRDELCDDDVDSFKLMIFM